MIPRLGLAVIAAAAPDGGHSYHHCAVLNITADRSKPIGTRW